MNVMPEMSEMNTSSMDRHNDESPMGGMQHLTHTPGADVRGTDGHETNGDVGEVSDSEVSATVDRGVEPDMDACIAALMDLPPGKRHRKNIDWQRIAECARMLRETRLTPWNKIVDELKKQKVTISVARLKSLVDEAVAKESEA